MKASCGGRRGEEDKCNDDALHCSDSAVRAKDIIIWLFTALLLMLRGCFQLIALAFRLFIDIDVMAKAERSMMS